MPTGSTALRVGVTGITSDLGRGLLRLLLADERVEQVVAFDVARAGIESPRVSFVHVDLTRPGMETTFTEALRAERIDVLYHLAFVNSRVHGPAFSHELEVIGSMHVLGAAEAVALPRVIVPSLTALYGARPGNPSRLKETHPLQGCTGSRFITDRVEVEQQVQSFAESHPGTEVVVLRFAPIVGANSDNPFTRLLRAPLVPTVLGFDPPIQVVAEEDAWRALHLALVGPARGVFNVVGDEALPLSAVVRLAKGRPLPLPGPVLRQTIRALETANVTSVPVPLLNYMRYAWLADGGRAARQLAFVPRSAVRDALARVPDWGKA